MKRILLILLLVAVGGVVWLRSQGVPEEGAVLSAGVLQPTKVPTEKPVAVEDKTQEIVERLGTIVSGYSGVYGVFAKDLSDGTEYGLRADETFPAASQMKLPIFLAAYLASESGKLNLEGTYVLRESDKLEGTTLSTKPAGSIWKYRDLLRLMGSSSDTTAARVLFRTVGSSAVEEAMVLAGMINSSFDGDRTTPEDVGRFFDKLYGGQLVQSQSKEELLKFLTDTAFEDKIVAGIPEEIQVAHKVGIEEGAYSDGGIVLGKRPFVLVVMSREADPKEASVAMSEVAKAVWEYEEGVTVSSKQ